MAARLIYITTETREQAGEIGETLVRERLAACANVIHPMTSVYWWQGEVQHGEETVLIAKTTNDLVEPLTARVRELHSYDCPCVVALPIEGGNPAFLDWIEAETGAR